MELVPRGVALAGETRFPVDVFVSSDQDFVGYELGGRFNPDQLTLVEVQSHFRRGSRGVDNVAGTFWNLSTYARRRMGAEGERVRVATAFFDISDSARGLLTLDLETVRTRDDGALVGHANSVNVLGLASGADFPVETSIEPLFVANAILRVQDAPTLPGDVDLDHELALTDAVVLLDVLFRGATGGIACPPAADFNEDGAVNLSDPIAILQHLYLGGPPEQLEATIDCR